MINVLEKQLLSVTYVVALIKGCCMEVFKFSCPLDGDASGDIII